MLVDTEGRSALTQGLNILGVQMEVTSSGQLQPVSEFTLQAIAEMLYARIVEAIFAAAMWRGHYMRDAVVDRRFSHRQRLFDLGGAVVNSGQYVAMQIHHTIANSWQATMTAHEGGPLRPDQMPLAACGMPAAPRTAAGTLTRAYYLALF